MSEELLKFNLNDSIFVKIHDEGYEHWMKKHNEYLIPDWEKPVEYFKSQADDNGYCKFHAWEFMQIFGGTIIFGTRPVFDTNILIESSSLKPQTP